MIERTDTPTRFQRNKERRRGCIISLVTIIIMLLSGYACLYEVDPLGARQLAIDLDRLFAGYVASPRGYEMYPGMYQFSNWSALIERSGNRSTPDSHASDCTIAFLGDSVSFGYGVNDADTFVNVLAKQMDAHVVNTAVLNYNIVNVRLTLADVPADGYVYIIIGNDDGATDTWRNHRPALPRLEVRDAIRLNFDGLMQIYGTFEHDLESFDADIAAMHARGDVLMVGFKDDADWYKRLPEYVIILPVWTQWNSFMDRHPNPEGHRGIAANLLPYVKEFEAEICQ